MTFTQIKTKILNYCNLSSTDADTRVGLSINAAYRRITSLLGMDPARFVTRSQSTTNGVATVVFTEIEKIDRVIDATTSTAIRLLQETSMHELRSSQPGTGQPVRWAFQTSDADSVTIRLDTLPQTTYSLQADGWTTLSDLSGSDEPVFPESFHDVLAWYVIAEELLKKEKDKLAREYERRADKLLAELRFHFADSHTRDTRQGGGVTAPGGAAGGSGSGSVGGTAYTQTALLTFDLGASTAPFAVAQATAPYVANLGAEFLGNITTDRLIGRDTAGTGESEQLTVGGGIEFTGSGGIQTSAFTGDVTKSAGGTAQTIPNDTVTYAKMQNVSAASRLLGRGSAGGSGDPEELTLGGGLSLSGTVLSAAAPLLLKANSGTTTTATAENVDTVAISGLTAKDTLFIYYTMESVTQATANPRFYNDTDAVLIAQVNNRLAISAGGKLIGHAQAMQAQSAATRVFGIATDINFGVADTTLLGSAHDVTFTTNWTGSWTLALRQGGVTAGGTFKWSWSVYKVPGQ
jgi:hypothetical protein